MERTIKKAACEHYSNSDYKQRAEIAHGKEISIATSVMRKAAIESFEAGAEYLKSFLLGKLQVYKGAMILDGYDPEDSCIKFMNELIEEINGGEYSSWISIEKRLPPVGTKVLVKTKNDNYLVSGMYIPTDCKGTVLGEKQWKGSGAFKDNIVKWRPIPE